MGILPPESRALMCSRKKRQVKATAFHLSFLHSVRQFPYFSLLFDVVLLSSRIYTAFLNQSFKRRLPHE